MKKNEIDLSRFSKRKAGIRKSTNNAVIYTRVSSKEQADKYSLQVQLDATIQYATRYNLPVIKTFGNTFESAKSDVDRLEFERLLKFVRDRKNDVKYIIVHTIDRFSRTGGSAIHLMDELEKNDDIIVTDTSRAPITSRRPSDNLSQNMLLMVGNYANEDRREKCRLGMIQALRNGDWPHKVPFGYNSIKTNGKRELLINEDGKTLQQAFYLRINQQLSMQEISGRLIKLGLKKITYKRLHRIFENIFFAGFLASSSTPGEIFKGNHVPLISQENFLKLREISDHFKKNKNSETKPKQSFPLLGDVRCSCCNTKLTAYKKLKNKKYYGYYKCNKKACRLNRSSDSMHAKFQELLSSFTLPAWLTPLLVNLLEKTFQRVNVDRKQNLENLHTTLDSSLRKLHSIEGKYLDDNINKETFDRHSTILKADIEGIQVEISALNNTGKADLSNFLTYALTLVQNLPEAYQQGTFTTKQTMQRIVFPEGVMYDRTTEGYRTQRVNEFFGLIRRLSGSYEKQKSGEISVKTNLSASVARRGIEPLFPE